MSGSIRSLNNLSRRAFLRKLGLAAAGLGSLGLSGSLSALAQTQPAPSPIDKSIETKINVLLDAHIAANSGLIVGVAAAVFYPGTKEQGAPVTQTFFRGETTQGNQTLPDSTTLFGIGSVGKVFTTTLLADLVFNQKLLALDDLVQPYYDKLAPGRVTLPTFKGQGIRFIDLATHTAGLPDQPGSIRDDGCGTPMAKVYEFLSHYKLPQAPGSLASYSDLGFDVLSDILNLISQSPSRNQSLIDLISRAQLNMPDTGAVTLDLQKNPRYSTGYDVDSKTNTISPAPQLTCDSGNDHVGQVVSTLNDMIEWAYFNLGLTNSPFNTLLPEIQKRRATMGGAMDYVALGWQLHPLPNDTQTYYYAKDGSSQLGYSADILFIPSRNIATIILANVNAIKVPGLNLRFLQAVNQTLNP